MKKTRRVAASPGRPPANAGRDARELLLNSATKLFAERGVAGTTLTMIAKCAGLTPAMLHYYFKDREQLCDAVVNERVLKIIAYVWNPVDPKAPAAETIRGVVERMLERIHKEAWVPSLWIREILNEGGALRERVLRNVPFDNLRLLAEAVARGQADGSANPSVEPLLVATSTIGLVMLSIAATKFFPQLLEESIRPEAIQRHVTSLLLDGVRINPPTRLGHVTKKQQ